MPAVTPPPIQAPPSQRRMRWWIIILGVIFAGIVLYGLARPKELGADWLAPIDNPQSAAFEEATQPAKTHPLLTSNTMGVKYALHNKSGGKQEISITTKNLDIIGNDIPRFDRADLFKADADNTVTLPDGTTVQLAEVIAYPGEGKPPLFFKLGNGTSTQVETSTAPLFRPEQLAPSSALQFVLNQNSSDAINPLEFTLYESATNRQIARGVGRSKTTLVSNNIPYMQQSPLRLLLQCDFGGTQQLTIPAIPDSFVEESGYVIRYCGSTICKASEFIGYTVNSEPPHSSSLSQGYLYCGNTDSRVFIFTQAIGPLNIISAEAVLENGKKIPLSRNLIEESSFQAFYRPDTAKEPIRSFVLTLPKRAARILFTVPRIQELWPTQNTKNRCDLRFSAAEAAQFKRQMQRYNWRMLMEEINGIRVDNNLKIKSPSSTHPLALFDPTGKTVRETFAFYLQQCGESPDDFAISLHHHGYLIFERKKGRGVYIWRWLRRNHPKVLSYIHYYHLNGWLEKIGIKEE